jgi:D-alanyl-D-alanine dipeptidase
VAKALSRVQQSLPKHLSLKVYDCYRPDHAVKSFVKWVKDVDAYDYAEQFYPRLKKKDLIKKGYIADRSSHSKGYVVDLTIVKKSRPMPELDELADYGDCTGQERLADNSIDMGTSFDCFDHLAHTSNRKISARARANRQLLVEAMKKEGFRNYKKEWWHFWYRGKKYKKVYDFPILPNN